MQVENKNIEPEIKYTIKAEEFIKAIKSKTTDIAKGLYVHIGAKIRYKSIIPDWQIKENDFYLILENTEVIGDVFIKEEIQVGFNLHLIFFNSKFDNINFRNTKFKNIYVIKTSIINFEIYNSKFGYFKIENADFSNILFTKSTAENIEISSTNINCFTLINSTSKEIAFSNTSIVSTEFKEKSSLRYLDLNNSTVKNIFISQSIVNQSITFKNNTICNKGLTITEDSEIENIIVTTHSSVYCINISNKCKIKDLQIESKSHSGDIWISDETKVQDIWISDFSMAGKIALRENCICGEIKIEDNSICSSITIRSKSKGNSIFIGNRSQTGEVLIKDAEVNSIIIQDNIFSFFIFNSSVSIIRIKRSTILHFKINTGFKGEIYIANCFINLFNLFETSITKDSLLSIEESSIFINNIQKTSVFGCLSFTNIKFHSFNKEVSLQKNFEKNAIETYLNEKVLLLKKLENEYNQFNDDIVQTYGPKPQWRLINSSLGKTEILGSDLSKYQFDYKDSKLLDMFISGTKLPKENIEIFSLSPEIPLEDHFIYEQKTSFYNQIKKVFENQGNIVESTWYHSKAMENQEKLLQLNNKKEKQGFFTDARFDLINFRWNKWTNNHGESWGRALVFVLISSVIMYICYYTCIHYNRPFNLSLKNIGDAAGNYFSFLNITRREDFMVNKEELNLGSKFFDYFSRVVIGFGIYQLIAAFRRHGKK